MDNRPPPPAFEPAVLGAGIVIVVFAFVGFTVRTEGKVSVGEACEAAA